MTAGIPNYSLRSYIESQNDFTKWGLFFKCMLETLELDEEEHQKAKNEYNILAHKIAIQLDIDSDDVFVFPQGSMATQTTIFPRGNCKFDIDIIVKFCGPKFNKMEPDKFFDIFGDTLRKCQDKDDRPSPKRRCWRLQLPNRPFYFDVTLAIPGSHKITGTDLRVRDPHSGWSPSNPEEFKEWFCKATERVPYISIKEAMVVDSALVEELPDKPISIHDILRSSVQIVKLHRDFEYFRAAPHRQEKKTNSVILVTLLTQAYNSILDGGTDRKINSPIKIMLEMIERVPDFIKMNKDEFIVSNPVHEDENFAERWNEDNNIKAKEFFRWHNQIKKDFSGLFSKDFDEITDSEIESLFGSKAAEVWKENFSPKSL